MRQIFSGIQPTGKKHLGNYIGAIRHYVEGQTRGRALYCIVDLHATTVPYEPVALRESLYDTTALLLAAGLDPRHCILFRQSDVSEHSELCWLLCGVAAHGELNRMTQFKEKSERQKSLVSVGLFVYPILQAADILLYDTDEVPVGDDQRQHLELARNIAERFNERFGKTFVVPAHKIPPVGARIMDLALPQQKMSTTGGSEQGTIYLLDDPSAIIKKFKAAVTDSGSAIRAAPDKPGISNLLQIIACVQGTTIADVEGAFAGSGYGAFKLAVADAVVRYLTPIRERFVALRADEARLEELLAEGAEKARSIAAATMTRVRERMGIGRGESPPRAGQGPNQRT